jgi:SPFH domain / Band 7 family
MEYPVLSWLRKNRTGVLQGVLGVSTSIAIMSSLRPIPAEHVGIVRNRSGGIRSQVFHSSEVPMIIPFWEHVILMREKPVQKRFIKEFNTQDNKTIETRLVISLQPPVHWMPEVFYKFGKDYGRTFLEREASIDCEEVCKKFTASDLLAEGDSQSAAVEDLRVRLQDAAAFHRLKITDLSVSFVDPFADLDEY